MRAGGACCIVNLVNKLLLLLGVIGGAALLASCARRADKEPPFVVSVRSEGNTCHVTVAGQRVASDELLEIALQASTRRAVVVMPKGTPFRCVGSVVFTLQRAGMVSVKAVPQEGR